MEELLKERYSPLKFLLTLIFITCLLVSNIIASKQILLPFDLVMPAAIIIFPITYILSDIFSEVYGYRWSRVTNYLGIILNLFTVLIFNIAINLKAPEYYEHQEAFKLVLGNTPRILLASTIGLWFGDYVNDNIFRKLKENHKDHKNYEIRAVVSSIGGQLGDSMIFIPIAFYGQMPFQVMITMIFTQALLKVGYEIIILPLSKRLMLLVSRYESYN